MMNNPFVPPADYTPDEKSDFYSDLVFLVVLTFLLILFIIYSIISLRNKDNRNVHNFIMTITTIGCLLTRYFCMSYSVYFDKNKPVSDYTI